MGEKDENYSNCRKGKTINVRENDQGELSWKKIIRLKWVKIIKVSMNGRKILDWAKIIGVSGNFGKVTKIASVGEFWWSKSLEWGLWDESYQDGLEQAKMGFGIRKSEE